MSGYLRILGLFPAALLAQPEESIRHTSEAERPPVIQLDTVPQIPAPKHTIAAGFHLQVAAAPPLVKHPIMGCADDQGNLYIGDAAGVNWTKAQLEEQPPNRVLKLTDKDGDGFYERSVVFADHMTFPQGACWLDGSLYVASPPGIWKLTDKDGDGRAEDREMIVGGFDYTGNAADVHGPKAHPNGRLYWCHGRKGHKVTQKDGTLVHEGMASGVWSCLPDGSDIRWHALGGADNPTSLAFTPKGEILGTTNLYKNQPRADTIMLWQYGGVYPRRDQMQVVEGLPLTFIDMPSLYDFGHVAVSGTSFWRAAGKAAYPPLMVTHFNTQRLVRMEMEEAGSAYKMIETEFLKIHEDDVHLTDVFEDPRDGSLILLNTGGWFRIGCPSSLMAKPEQHGAVYRIRTASTDKNSPFTPGLLINSYEAAEKELVGDSSLTNKRIAMEWLLEYFEHQQPSPKPSLTVLTALKKFSGEPQDEFFLHAWLRLARYCKIYEPGDLSGEKSELELKHLLWYFRSSSDNGGSLVKNLLPLLRHKAPEIQKLTLETLAGHPASAPRVEEFLFTLLSDGVSGPHTLDLTQVYLDRFLTQNSGDVRSFLGKLLSSQDDSFATLAIRFLASQPKVPLSADWQATLLKRLQARPSLELIDVISRLPDSTAKESLRLLSEAKEQTTTLRIKALAGLSSKTPDDKTLDWLADILTPSAGESLASRITAAKILANFQLSPAQLSKLAPLFSQVGPIELAECLPILRNSKTPTILEPLCKELAKNPAILSQQESIYRNQLSHSDPQLFEKIIAPAYRSAEIALASKKLELNQITTDARTSGDARKGKQHFSEGKGSCVACHRVGDEGGIVGPNLSHIGGIRKERDLVESILFPSNTLARDYESQVFELRGGESVMGVIRSHAAEGIIISDAAGQTRTLPHDQIISQITLPSSMMPMGLENTMSRQELLDLVAYLQSLN